ncbi:hypothetical protein ACFE04_019725 [Oxalis oulophora]
MKQPVRQTSYFLILGLADPLSISIPVPAVRLSLSTQSIAVTGYTRQEASITIGLVVQSNRGEVEKKTMNGMEGLNKKKLRFLSAALGKEVECELFLAVSSKRGKSAVFPSATRPVEKGVPGGLSKPQQTRELPASVSRIPSWSLWLRSFRRDSPFGGGDSTCNVDDLENRVRHWLYPVCPVWLLRYTRRQIARAPIKQELKRAKRSITRNNVRANPMDGSLPLRSELIPTFVSRKAINGSDLPVGHFGRRRKEFTINAAKGHQFLINLPSLRFINSCFPEEGTSLLPVVIALDLPRTKEYSESLTHEIASHTHLRQKERNVKIGLSEKKERSRRERVHHAERYNKKAGGIESDRVRESEASDQKGQNTRLALERKAWAEEGDRYSFSRPQTDPLMDRGSSYVEYATPESP